MRTICTFLVLPPLLALKVIAKYMYVYIYFIVMSIIAAIRCATCMRLHSEWKIIYSHAQWLESSGASLNIAITNACAAEGHWGNCLRHWTLQLEAVFVVSAYVYAFVLFAIRVCGYKFRMGCMLGGRSVMNFSQVDIAAVKRVQL